MIVAKRRDLFFLAIALGLIGLYARHIAIAEKPGTVDAVVYIGTKNLVVVGDDEHLWNAIEPETVKIRLPVEMSPPFCLHFYPVKIDARIGATCEAKLIIPPNIQLLSSNMVKIKMVPRPPPSPPVQLHELPSL